MYFKNDPMRKFNFVYIGIIALFALLLVACNDNDPEEIKLDFNINLPENWTGKAIDNWGLVYVAGRNLEGGSDTIAEMLYVVKEGLVGYTLDEYYDALVPKIKNPNKYVSQIYVSDTVINDLDYKKLVSREIYKYANPPYDSMTLNVISDRYFCKALGNAYNMSFFSVDTLYFKKNRAIFNEIMSSIEF